MPTRRWKKTKYVPARTKSKEWVNLFIGAENEEKGNGFLWTEALNVFQGDGCGIQTMSWISLNFEARGTCN